MQNAFIGRTQKPTGKDLATALGESKVLWDQLVTEMARAFGVTGQEWNSYSPKAGWSLRLQQRKRNIIYLVPYHAGFGVALVLGEKAMTSARGMEFPPNVVRLLKEAKWYPEGFAVRFAVNTAKDVDNVAKLVRAKIEN
jgi:hypothetical protein